MLRSVASLTLATALPAAFAQTPTVTISPGYTSIGVNQTLQYTATVTGLTNTDVTWGVVGKVGGNATYGTITTGGLYTAPAAIPANGITITALASDKKTSATVYVNVAPAGPTITSISPNPVPTGSYTITVTGSGFVSGIRAMQNGATSGATFVNSTTVKLSGWWGTPGNVPIQLQNPGTLWGPVFNLQMVASGPPPPQTISPKTVSVNLGATQQFSSNNATNWSASAGTITSTGLFTAPSTMPASSKVTVTASGAGGSASATVTLINPNAQSISPTAISLNLGATYQFTGAGATGWSASYGSVSTAGFYTAPTQMPSSGTDTVTASGPNGSASATVTLIPPAPSITGVTPSPLPLGVFSATVTGTGFLANSTATLNGTPLSVAFGSAGTITITGSATASGSATLLVSNGSQQSSPFTVAVGVASPQVSAAAARRFLEQAAFGPSPSDAANVQQLGFQGWLNQQFTMPQVSNYNSVTGSQGGLPQHFLANAAMNSDQLRQRVAFVLSQIFVVSINKLIWNSNVGPYETMLLTDAFSNFRQILNDVTLSPAMGYYLDMANNAAGNASGTILANENYAREVMQLFSIGTVKLNSDGTQQLDGSGNPIPTYGQPTIQQFAKVFTGWTFYQGPTATPYFGYNVDGTYASTSPMIPMQQFHDVTQKTLLNGVVLPAGQTAQQDLQQALDNIFNHPNVGPFIGTQLIQHLVKSNPSPAYVGRVAAAFNNDGTGARGNMQAVISAVLLDPEARANDNGGNDQPGDGHIIEPALFIPALFRAFGGTITDQSYFEWDLVNMSQDLFNPPSVFNYYSPGQEIQIYTPYTAIYRDDMVASLFGSWSNPVVNWGTGTQIDLSAYVPLASNATALVNALDLALTHGTMPAAMKAAVIAGVTAEPNGSLKKVETGIYLIATSDYYNVWH
jgi:uncharacterized protein (DUF1800 family)